MPLEEYRRKRDFAKTPEPAGDHRRVGPGRAGRFVVQRHRATRLHYDFRLEIGGVLASWAIPKGPTLDPAQRRMAVHVEDHPIEYFDFEGVIPARQYGAGDVIVWDWGTFEPEAETPEPARAIAEGELKFRLRGEKLGGRFTLVRTDVRRRGGRVVATGTDGDGKEQWLLIKKRDEAAVDGWDAEDHPQSVKTGRTNDEVKAERDALWMSQAPAATAEIDLGAAVAKPMPDFVEPMAATLASTPFSSDDWLFEIKWDGYRVEAVVAGERVRLYTRRGNDAETYFPRLLSPPSWIDAERAIVDGEVVALDPDGAPSFELLQQRISGAPGAAEAPLVYQAFDLLYLDGRSLLKVPLDERKALLRSVLRPQPRVRFADHVVGEGEAFFRAAAERELEGIIAKHRRSLYEPGRRSLSWLKLKVRGEQELVVGGWLPGEGNAKDLGALIVGTFEDGHFRYGGRVGSGFTARTRADLRKRLEALSRETAAFEPPPPKTGDLRAARWVEPSLVIRAEFSNWTRDGIVRQSAFKGLEPEKDPKSVTRERAVEPKAADRQVESLLGSAGAAETAEVAPPARRRRTPGDRSKPSDDRPTPESAQSKPEATVSKAVSGRSKPEATLSKAVSGRSKPVSGRSKPEATMSKREATVSKPEAGQSKSEAAMSKPESASSKPEGTGSKPASGHPTQETRRSKGPGLQPKSAPRGSKDGDALPPAATQAELEALAALGQEGLWHVGGESLKLTNLDKVLFPPGEASDHGARVGQAAEDGPITKRELIGYFAQIAPAMLPHLAERPLNLHRYPNGTFGQGFWQKDIPPHAPTWLRIWHEVGVGDERDANDHLVADRVATLAWLGNQAAFEIHAWTARLDDLEHPSYALIDIDPGDRTTWDETLTLARLFRTALEHLRVKAWPKLTGQRGIQIWIPIVPRYTFRETSAWVEGLSRAVGATVPDLVSWEWSKSARRGRARLDYTQNASIKTLVAPYAVRPAAGAPVSAPIDWSELDDPDIRPNRWTIRSIIGRVAERGDLFAGVLTNAQELPRLG